MAELFDPNRLGLSSLRKNVQDAISGQEPTPAAPSYAEVVDPDKFITLGDIVRAIPPANIPKIVRTPLPQRYDVRFPPPPVDPVRQAAEAARDRNRIAQVMPGIEAAQAFQQELQQNLPSGPQGYGLDRPFTPQRSVRTLEGGTIAQDVPGWNALSAPAVIADFFRTQQPGPIDPTIMARQAAMAASPAARQNTAPLPVREDRARGEPYVTAAQASASRVGGTAGTPISVVRALQNTNYLPVMDAQGRVSYQSEGLIQEQAAKRAAAEQAAAETTKTKAQTAKDLAAAQAGAVTEYYLNRRKGLQAFLEELPESDSRRVPTEAEMKRLDAILAPRTQWIDASVAPAFRQQID